MYRKIFEKSIDGIFIIQNNKYIDCNDSAVKMFRYESKKQLFNKHPSFVSPKFQPNGKSSFKEEQEHINYAYKNGNHSFQWLHLRADGETFWAQVVLADISTKNKKLLFVIVKDISEKKLLREQNDYQRMILSSVLDTTPDLIFYKDYLNHNGCYIGCNTAFEKFISKKKEEIIGKTSIELFGEKIGTHFCTRDKEVLNKETMNVSEEWIECPNGKKVLLNISKLPFKDKDDNIIGILSVARDITEQKKAKFKLEKQNKALKQTEKKLTKINYNLTQYFDALDKLEIGIFVVREDFVVQHMNKTMIKWFGNQEGKICYSSVANLDEPCPYCQLSNVILHNKKVVYEPTTPDGQSFHIVATSIKNLDGSISKMEVIRNITEQKNIQNLLDYQAHHDILTGLPNRVLFNDRLVKAIEKAKRNNSKFALLFIDLDYFKEINDSLGHAVGDEILKVVTARLKKVIREEDTVARFGGDEFIIILEDLKNAQDSSLVAEKILNVLSQSMSIDNNLLYISSSIGISIYPDDGTSVQNLLKYADSAMYKAKAEGRNNYQYYNATMTELAVERVTMETNLREAIEKEQFVVYYQPQVNAVTGKITGMEALVRWQHPTIGLVPPSKFIPLAEVTGLIIILDRIVMKKAMMQIAMWYKEGLNPGILSMNLAIKQLKQKDFIQTLKNLMEETGCKAEWIEFEITESQIMTDPKESIKVLTQISDLGIELAIDDFGTGYSSLAYLKKLPIDKLKIDRAFIKDLPHDKDDVGITKAVIALAKGLKLKIIAEGVETKEQRDFIVKNGCKNIQGYFYFQPVCADEIKIILSKEKGKIE